MEEKQEYKSLSLRSFDSSVGKAEDCRSEVGILMSLVQIWLLEGTFFLFVQLKHQYVSYDGDVKTCSFPSFHLLTHSVMATCKTNLKKKMLERASAVFFL